MPQSVIQTRARAIFEKRMDAPADDKLPTARPLDVVMDKCICALLDHRQKVGIAGAQLGCIHRRIPVAPGHFRNGFSRFA